MMAWLKWRLQQWLVGEELRQRHRVLLALKDADQWFAGHRDIRRVVNYLQAAFHGKRFEDISDLRVRIQRSIQQDAAMRMEWQPLETAPRSREEPVLVKFKDDLEDDNGPSPFAGRQAVMHYDGPGWMWCYAGPVGCGGIPDSWLQGWKRL